YNINAHNLREDRKVEQMHHDVVRVLLRNAFQLVHDHLVFLDVLPNIFCLKYYGMLKYRSIIFETRKNIENNKFWLLLAETLQQHYQSQAHESLIDCVHGIRDLDRTVARASMNKT
ncbi:hypothetical protein ACJX0J_015594, partial [Zea mays]